MADPIRVPLRVSEPLRIPLTLESNILPKIIEGISPEVSLQETENGVVMTVTDKTGTETALIPKGDPGQPGEPGEPGEPGQPGSDGVSPTISVTDITGGHRVTITDATGEHSFDVMDGSGGAEIDDTAGAGDTDVVWSANKSSSEIGAKYTKPSGGIPASDLASGVIPAVPVQDVQVNGTSILSDGVANVPVANSSSPGVVKVDSTNGIGIESQNKLYIEYATSALIKAGTGNYRPITPPRQQESVFYGLAKLAGADMASSSNPVGTYTDAAKSAISTMLNGAVSVSGTTPSITGLAGLRYVCGECATLSITPPATGIIDVVFQSGSTATVLTVTPPTGMTMKWANGFDPTSLDANTVYEINIMDGCYGVVGSWT